MFKTRKEAIDALQVKWTEKLAHEAAAEECKQEQKKIEAWLIADFVKCKIAGADGTNWTVWKDEALFPTLTDFEAFAKNVAKRRDWHLHYRRFNVENVKTRFEQGVVIPGIGWEPITKIYHRSK